jgi:cyclase
MQKLSEHIYVETQGRGCNTSFVVTKEGSVMIDTPMVPADARKWKAEAEKMAPLKYVINTEPHNDHCTGNCWLGATLIGHELTRQAITENKAQEFAEQLKWMAPDAVPLDPAFRYRPSDITFSQNLTLYMGDRTLCLMLTPGHTAGETAIYVPEEKTIFTGDNMNLNVPIFVKSLPYEWIASLKRIQQMDVEKVVPGHGPVCDKVAIGRMIDSVQYMIDKIKPAAEKGWSIEETLQKVSLDDRYPGMLKHPQLGGMMKNSLVDLLKSLK